MCDLYNSAGIFFGQSSGLRSCCNACSNLFGYMTKFVNPCSMNMSNNGANLTADAGVQCDGNVANVGPKNACHFDLPMNCFNDFS